MGRPKFANPETFHLYNILHTEKSEMYCGVDLTILHSLKECKEWYNSIEVWAFCARKFKSKKKNLIPEINIPVVLDEKTIDFLNKHCWKEWTTKQKNESDMQEAIAALDKIFPDKEKIFFYELESLVVGWCNGYFISYDANGQPEKPKDYQVEQQKYYNYKYNRYLNIPHINELRDKFKNEQDKDLSKKYLTEYLREEEEYAFQHFNLNDIFIQIGQNVACYPFIFSEGTADWYKEKYGKVCPYAHAGEIFFVVTPNKVFFEIKRHF